MADENIFANEDQIYYDMRDNAAAIDGVVHDLIETLNAEDIGKYIFVTQTNDDTSPVEYHLSAKDFKTQMSETLGEGGDENEILVGADENKIKGSGVYLNRNEAAGAVQQVYNSHIIQLEGNQSLIRISPNMLVFEGKRDSEGNLPAIDRGTLVLRENALSIGGSCGKQKYGLVSTPDRFLLSGIDGNGQNTYSISIEPVAITMENGKVKRLSLNPAEIKLEGGTGKSEESQQILHMTGRTSLSMTDQANVNLNHNASIAMTDQANVNLNHNASIAMKESTEINLEGGARIISPTRTNVPEDAGMKVCATEALTSSIGPQFYFHEQGSIFMRGNAVLYMDSVDPYMGRLPLGAGNVQRREANKYLSAGSCPVIAAQGKPFVYFGGTPIVHFNNNARFMIDGQSRLTMHGEPLVDITGRNTPSLSPTSDFDNGSQGSLSEFSPRIFIHDGVFINIDNGYQSASSFESAHYNYTGPIARPFDETNPCVEILIHDRATIDMSGGCYLSLKDGAFFNMTSGSAFSMQDISNIDLSGMALLRMHGAASVFLDDNSLFRMSNYNESSDDEIGNSPAINMSGSCYLCMQSLKPKIGPLLVGECNSLIFMGDGTKTSPTQTEPQKAFGDEIKNRLNKFVTIPNRWGDSRTIYVGFTELCPCVKIGGNTTLNLDNSNSGGTYIRIGNPDNTSASVNPKPIEQRINILIEGDTYIKTANYNNIDLEGCWIQTTGNSHTEIHDNTQNIFRGQLRKQAAWLDGLEFCKMTKQSDGTLKWNDYSSARFATPHNSPVIQMYDSPNFCMRGTWTTPQPVTYTRTFEVLKDTNEALYNELSVLDGQTNVTEIPLSLETYLIEQINNRDSIYYYEAYPGATRYYQKQGAIETVQSIDSIDQVQVTETKIVLSKVKYTSQQTPPEGWSDRAAKVDGSPVLEVIENADVRVSKEAVIEITENAQLKMDDNGITLGPKGNFHFSVEELAKLKQLLAT